MAAFTFLIIGAALALGAAAWVAWPLIARSAAPESRAETEIRLLKAQLAEIERDVTREALSPADADAARREIARKLLAADAARAEETALAAAPAAISHKAALGAVAGLPLVALAAYLAVGAPTKPDQPLAQRDITLEKRALLLTQAEAEAQFGAQAAAEAAAEAGPPSAEAAGEAERFEALASNMRTLLASRPEDSEGRLILAQALRARGAHAEAWRLIGEALAIIGEAAPEELHVYLAEEMTLAAGGYVSQEAEAAFARAPDSGASRYYLGLAALQRGERTVALNAWSELLVRARRGERRSAEFEAQLERQIRAVAVEAQFDPDRVMASIISRAPAAPASAAAQEDAPAADAETAPGPTADDVAAAAAMTPAERLEMIRGMVDSLAARLEAEPQDLQGWLRLIRALGVLDERDRAAAALETARTTFAADAAALEALGQAGAEIGL